MLERSVWSGTEGGLRPTLGKALKEARDLRKSTGPTTLQKQFYQQTLELRSTCFSSSVETSGEVLANRIPDFSLVRNPGVEPVQLSLNSCLTKTVNVCLTLVICYIARGN